MTPFPSFPLNGEGECRVFMKHKKKKPLNEQRRIVANLDACRQGQGAAETALRERGRIVCVSADHRRTNEGNHESLP